VTIIAVVPDPLKAQFRLSFRTIKFKHSHSEGRHRAEAAAGTDTTGSALLTRIRQIHWRCTTAEASSRGIRDDPDIYNGHLGYAVDRES
jgi:hypothetical protein